MAAILHPLVLTNMCDHYDRVRRLDAEAAELTAAVSGPDREFAAMAAEELPKVRQRAEEVLSGVLSQLVTADDRRIGSVMLELRAGTGGDEAALWCGDLLAMYTKYAGLRGWTAEVLDLTPETSAGGVRAVVVNLKGQGVWAELCFEAGVHCVKRVPATESQGRVHTSTATVAVLPEPEAVEVKIDWDKDVEENVTTSQGPGGQNVNKVATAVQLHHKPSGIIIRMQESKSQHQNRDKAKRLLITKLYDLEQQKKQRERTDARRTQIGTGERSERVRTYRYKDGIVADERLPGEYTLRTIISGELTKLVNDLIDAETTRRLSEL
jgi:peptide chain release factor 1